MTRAGGSQKVAEALAIIRELGLPRRQQNERSALTLLALVDLRPGGSWADLADEKIAAIPVFGKLREMGYAPSTALGVRCTYSGLKPSPGLPQVPLYHTGEKASEHIVEPHPQIDHRPTP